MTAIRQLALPFPERSDYTAADFLQAPSNADALAWLRRTADWPDGRLVIWGEELLNRIPVVRSVYGGVKSFAESVFSQSNSFRKVVMIEYPRAGAWSIGFMTAENVPEITARTGEPHVCVYVSAALNATAGWLVVVPRRQVVELDMTVDAAMKMIITCGVVVPPAPAEKYPPLPETVA